MEIRKTRSDELETLMKMYENARIFMAENGNPDQWGKNIRKDLLSPLILTPAVLTSANTVAGSLQFFTIRQVRMTLISTYVTAGGLMIFPMGLSTASSQTEL